MKLTITKLYRSKTDKAGKPLIFKDRRTGEDRPYEKIAIKCREYGDRWISGFVAPWCADWAEGQEVEAEVIEAGQFLNLRKPDPVKTLLVVVNQLSDRVASLERGFLILKDLVGPGTPAKASNSPVEPSNARDTSGLPF